MSAMALRNPLAEATAVVAVADPKLRRQVIDALGQTPVQVIDDNHCPVDLEELVAHIELLRPSVLFLGVTGFSADISAAVARVSSLEFAPRVVAVGDAPHADVILTAMRAGAAEFIFPPLEPGFEAALRSVVIAARTQQQDMPVTGKVIGFSSVKGGCGATTLACHSASWLRSFAKKEVLLADLDTSAGIAGVLMRSAARYTLDDALQNLHRLDLKMWKTLVATSPCGVDVIPAPTEPASAVPISRKLPPMARFWRMQYEYTMVDFGHGITPALLDMLNSIDTLILVATAEVPALRQATQMIQYLAAREFGPNRLKLVLNRMPRRPPIELAELEKIIGLPVHSAIPNDYQALNAAYSESRLIDFASGLGIGFGAFAAKLAGIDPNEKKSRGFFAFR